MPGRQDTDLASLKEGEQDEQEEPEDAHGMPVPGGAVYEYLPILHLLRAE